LKLYSIILLMIRKDPLFQQGSLSCGTLLCLS